MSESLQAVLALVMIIGIIGSVLSIGFDPVRWPVMLGMVTLAVGSLGLLLWSLFRRDKAPDYLKNIAGGMFERDGLCFKLAVNPVKGRCYLDLHFQSRHDRPSRAVVVLRPSKGFFLVRPGLAGMTVDIECPAAGYGVTQVPWPVARKFQGKTLSLDVGADVFYPEGRGTMVRYRGGLQVGTAGIDHWRRILTVAGALGGVIVLSKPAMVKVKLPEDVEESVDDDLPILSRVVWKLGDAPDPNSTKKPGEAESDFGGLKGCARRRRRLGPVNHPNRRTPVGAGAAGRPTPMGKNRASSNRRDHDLNGSTSSPSSDGQAS